MTPRTHERTVKIMTKTAKILSEPLLCRFARHLRESEKSPATARKYLHDARALRRFADGAAVTKEMVIAFKQHLLDSGYAARSVNGILAGLHSLFDCLGWQELKVRTLKVQREIFCPAERELTKAEYERLCRAAAKRANARLNLILQTICGTGIRVSELQCITVDAARRGEAVVTCKGKTRTVFLVRPLQKKLLRYAAERGIASGPIFITRSGKPMNRSCVWREMKSLCTDAGVSPGKVFPHNLRHLFARVFYGIEKDIAKLADILGHSSINTTRIYIMSTGTEHRRRMETMHLIL